MRSLTVLALLLLAACAPPEKVDLSGDTASGVPAKQDPSIRIVHPLQGGQIELEEDCSLELVVAVQIEDFTLVDFAENPTPAPGEGHWHVEMTGDASYTPSTDRQAQVLVRPEMQPASVAVTATLVDSQHQPIDGGSSLAEITLVNPPGVTCPLSTI